jgi:hypothetical protein
MGIFSSLRAWFGGKPSMPVMGIETTASASDYVTESTAVSITPEPFKFDAPIATQYDYSPIISAPEAPAGSSLAPAEVHDVTPITATAPTIASAPAISTTDPSVNVESAPVHKPARPKPRARSSKTGKSRRAHAKR